MQQSVNQLTKGLHVLLVLAITDADKLNHETSMITAWLLLRTAFVHEGLECHDPQCSRQLEALCLPILKAASGWCGPQWSAAVHAGSLLAFMCCLPGNS
jgi:hypothetical protein